MTDQAQDIILLEALKKKEAYYKAILELAEEEHRKLENKRPFPELVSLMKKKQILLSCIEECDEAINPLKEEWGKGEKSLHFESIQKQINLLDVLIRELLGLDDQNRKLFEKRLCSATQKTLF